MLRQLVLPFFFLALCPPMTRLHSLDAFVHFGPSHMILWHREFPFLHFQGLMSLTLALSDNSTQLLSVWLSYVPHIIVLEKFFGEGQSQLHFLLSTQEVHRSLPLQSCHFSLSSKPASANLYPSALSRPQCPANTKSLKTTFYRTSSWKHMLRTRVSSALSVFCFRLRCQPPFCGLLPSLISGSFTWNIQELQENIPCYTLPRNL